MKTIEELQAELRLAQEVYGFHVRVLDRNEDEVRNRNQHGLQFMRKETRAKLERLEMKVNVAWEIVRALEVEVQKFSREMNKAVN